MGFFGKIPPIAAAYADYPVPLKLISPLSADVAAQSYEALKDPATIETYGENDKSYPSAVCFYRAPFLADCAAAVSRQIRPLLEYDIVETYWYARLYGMGDKLDIHVDRGECFVSVSVCFGYDFNELFPQGSTWPLAALTQAPDGGEREVPFNLKPGEGVLYPGCAAPHWRDVFLGDRCGQAFFHYVPAEASTFGEYFGDKETREKR